MDIQGRSFHITGIVQGVGFRPFVYGLAQRFELTGWIRNSSAGVDINVDGRPDQLVSFSRALREEAPPLAAIEDIQLVEREPNGFAEFEIVQSEAIPGAFQPISPDVSICSDCLSELFDPDDRRYRYPFINCTNCGPRFTIIRDIPYDRPETTMAPFEMCPACAAEYRDPEDRRFHAQPVACHDCGPQIWFEEGHTTKKAANREGALRLTRERIVKGQIVAIKGVGGFHLACDATNRETVTTLRQRKLRVDKPFALMMSNLEAVEAHAYLSAAEKELLLSRERPIVILARRPESQLPAETAPGQNSIGVMLPYTPLHHLLLEPAAGYPEALVMTSGNLSEEPIASDNSEARSRLSDLADSFLFHDREIETRCDDSVVRSFPSPFIRSDDQQIKNNNLYPIRRARGYAPFPVQLPWESAPILAGGAELKNSFCLTRDKLAILSHHIGDLENFQTLEAFESAVEHFERLFRIRPAAFAYDLHPNYLASRYLIERAKAEDLPGYGIQHHHAHIASAMAEHGLTGDGKVIGFSFDGTGYGTDGAIWGGEVMAANYDGFERLFHLDYAPLPGGEKAIKEPWRYALSWLKKLDVPWDESLPAVNFGITQSNQEYDQVDLLRRQLEVEINCPPTSSIGRLFDAAASLIGLRHVINFEGQAAIELEAVVDNSEGSAYRIDLNGGTLDPGQMIIDLLADVKKKVTLPILAARFHNALAQLVVDAAIEIRREHELDMVVLSGGVWQNTTLLARTVPLLRNKGFSTLLHRQVPTNDGGLSLGQAAITAHQLREGS